MKAYYKATRPDGRAFYDGSVDYAAHLASGTPLKRLTSSITGIYECCTGTVYHAADTPSETLIGGSWPCRLFEVTGRPVAQQGHKFGFRSLRVVREIEAWRALGPNGVAVAAHIERVKTANTPEIAAWDAARAAAWDAARAAARAAAWDAVRAAVRAAARAAAWDAARAAAWDAVRAAARDAAGDAAGALVIVDLISEEHFATLTDPWVSVMGPL